MKLPKGDLLETLIAVAETESLAQAGARLGITQPAVTQKLQRLAGETPIPVLESDGKRKSLTRFGQALYRIAKKRSQELEADYEALERRFGAAEHQVLRVGGRREMLEVFGDRFLFEGRTEFLQMSGPEAVAALKTHAVDIAISVEPPDSLQFAAKRLAYSTTRFAVHRKFTAAKPVLPLYANAEFLTGTPAVLYHSDGRLLTELLAEAGLRLADIRVRAVVEDWHLLMHLVDEGAGYAVVPDYIEPPSRDILVTDIPHSVVAKREYSMIFPKDLKKIEGFKNVPALG